LFSGVLVSWEFLIATEKKEERKFMKRISIIGISLIISGVFFDLLPIQIYPTYNYWFTSPNYFFVRVGALLILTACSWWAANAWSLTSKLWTICGQESLFIYVLHLPLIYGSVINTTYNIGNIVGANLGILQTLGVFISFSCFVVGLALFWNYLKRKHFNYYRLVQLAAAGVFLYVLFTRDN
jgi:peptidoglycan/LPS O-acetylase OafA/YrhL